MSDDLLRLTGRWWDWRIESWDGRFLRLIADNDLTYHHEVEVTFVEAAYIVCPVDFSHPTFRPPTEEERARVRAALGDDDFTVFAWDIDAEEPGRGCVVAARSMYINEGLVRHEWRRS